MVLLGFLVNPIKDLSIEIQYRFPIKYWRILSLESISILIIHKKLNETDFI